MFKNGKKDLLGRSSWEREVRKCRDNPADIKVNEEEGEEVLQTLEQNFSCSS